MLLSSEIKTGIKRNVASFLRKFANPRRPFSGANCTPLKFAECILHGKYCSAFRHIFLKPLSENCLAEPDFRWHELRFKSARNTVIRKSYQMYRKSLMNKESVLIKLGRILRVKTLNFSKWHVDGPIEIPIRQKFAVVPRFRNAPPRRCKTVKRRAAFFALALAVFAAVSVKASQSVSLAWNTSSGIAGYIVYAGNSPGNYSSQMNVGTNTTVTITGLNPGKTNYFAVASYNSANLVGNPSSPVSYIVPGLLQLTRVAGSAAPTLSFPTAVGHYYIIQATTNFVTWANIYESSTATTNAWATFQDNTSGSMRSRFYRLIMH